jgi:hypothetical protein
MTAFRGWGQPNKRATPVRGPGAGRRGPKRVYPTGRTRLAKHPRLRRLGSNGP